MAINTVSKAAWNGVVEDEGWPGRLTQVAAQEGIQMQEGA